MLRKIVFNSHMFKYCTYLSFQKFLMRFILVIAVVMLQIPVANGFNSTWKSDFTWYSSKYYKDLEYFGAWFVQFGGGGTVGIESNKTNTWMHLSPKAATAPDITHASLATTHSFAAPFQFQSKISTVKQLRTGSTPNAWEVAWVVWNYTDNDHFYYFIPKPNGWELGKRDPAYPGGQRFLATGSNIKFPIRKNYVVDISQDSSNKISVFVNSTKITSFTDTENPYKSGMIGVYTEDAHIHFDDVLVSY